MVRVAFSVYVRMRKRASEISSEAEVRVPTLRLARPFASVLSLDGCEHTSDFRTSVSAFEGNYSSLFVEALPNAQPEVSSPKVCPQPSSDKPNAISHAESQSGSSDSDAR